MNFRTMIALAAATVAGAVVVGAQEPDSAAAPSCAEQGAKRLVVMVPPGRTEADVRELVRGGAVAPAGTEVFVVPAGHFMEMRNQKQFGERLNTMLHGFVFGGTKVDGAVSILLRLDDTGAVESVHPGTGNRRLDRDLTRTWKEAEFEPYEIGGCRVPAWINVPLAFTSDFSHTERRMEARPVQP